MNLITLPNGSPNPLPELAVFLKPFTPLFRHATSHSSQERYVMRMPDLPRKDCKAIAQAVAHISPEQLQHLLTNAGNGILVETNRIGLTIQAMERDLCS